MTTAGCQRRKVLSVLPEITRRNWGYEQFPMRRLEGAERCLSETLDELLSGLPNPPADDVPLSQ